MTYSEPMAYGMSLICSSTASAILTRVPRRDNSAPMRRILILVLLLTAIAAAQAPPQSLPTPAILQNYKAVTADRLKKPEDADWLMIRRTYDGWGYSPLEQITPKNVAKLQ